MIDLTTLPLTLTVPVGFLGGFVIGHGYFRALRQTTELIVGEGAPLKALALTLGRLSLVITGFFIAVLAGGAVLLAALAGLLCAKALIMRHMRKETP